MNAGIRSAASMISYDSTIRQNNYQNQRLYSSDRQINNLMTISRLVQNTAIFAKGVLQQLNERTYQKVMAMELEIQMGLIQKQKENMQLRVGQARIMKLQTKYDSVFSGLINDKKYLNDMDRLQSELNR